MAENDIYNNEKKYSELKEKIKDYVNKPTGRRKYQIKYANNVKYFSQLFNKFEAKDLSYIRRIRLIRSFLIVNYAINKDLAKVTRDDMDKLMIISHKINNTPKTKEDFVKDVKYIWKMLFPEKDEKGRYDETIYPYVVRALNGKVDKSREKMREDKFSMEEFHKLVSSFGNDTRIQALLTLALESLGRPQELLGRKLKDVELFDNYAKVYISEHGKEGIGFLRCIDSFPYVAKWYNEHPLKNDPKGYFFINLGTRDKYQQLKPVAVNKLIREHCKMLGIKKPITLYSLKRMGVTIMRLQGKSDVDIQHTARWTSTKQLKTYDLSTQDESFKIELIKRGIIKPDERYKEFQPTTKSCLFCGKINGIAETICSNCRRPLDRNKIIKEEEELKKKLERIETFEKDIAPQITKEVETKIKQALDIVIDAMPESTKKKYIEKYKELTEAKAE